MWERFIAQGEEIQHQVSPDIGYELHIHVDEQPSRHISLIGVEVAALAAMPLEMVAMVVPGGTYARFTHLFKNSAYRDAFKTAYDWIEDSDYEPAYPFEIQVYDECFNGLDDPESVLEILVPVQKKIMNGDDWRVDLQQSGVAVLPDYVLRLSGYRTGR